jgi:hypothetical protein
LADLFEQFKLTQTAGYLGRESRAGGVGIELDAGATAGTEDHLRGEIARRQCALAMRTETLHGNQPPRWLTEPAEDMAGTPRSCDPSRL